MNHWTFASPGLKFRQFEEFLESRGSPHKTMPPVIHVTGTNGKGSTIAIMGSVLQHMGLKVHVYTSPHLVCWSERIIVANHPIRLQDLENFLCALCRDPWGSKLSLFQALTFCAFQKFSENVADVVLLEVGIGGRWDTTNVISHKMLTIITALGLDHQEILGNTIEDIAQDKVGILRPYTPVIVAKQKYVGVNEIIARYAQKLSCPCWIAHDHLGQNTEFHSWLAEVHPSCWNLRYGHESFSYPLPSLRGQHQIMNAATAVMGLHVQKRWTVTQKDYNAGLRCARWPGRLQCLSEQERGQFFPPARIWLDGAHNRDGFQALLSEFSPSSTLFVWGMLQRKNPRSVESMMKDRRVYGVQNWNADAADLTDFCEHTGELNALPTYLQENGQGIRDLVFCGSLIFIGNVLSWLKDYSGLPLSS